MKKGLLTGACLFVFSVLVAGNVYAGTRAKITLKIVDDENKPIPKVNVNVGFYDRDVHKGSTDTNGLFTTEGSALLNEATYRAEKGGYYRSEGVYRFMGGIKNDRCEPWDPVVTVVVRQVVNPIPMYAKRIDTHIPVTNQNYGFDLSIGDWVQPVGKGIVRDLVFRIDGYWNNYRENDSTLTLIFSEAKDGIIPFDYPVANNVSMGSEFILPRQAPLEGYSGTNTWRRARTKAVGGGQDQIIDDLRSGRGYIFRIRSITNEQGIVSAYYGAMPCKVDFVGANKDPKEGSWLSFTYYLNPTPNDRNLEFDPKKNLFKNLKSTEQVTAP